MKNCHGLLFCCSSWVSYKLKPVFVFFYLPPDTIMLSLLSDKLKFSYFEINRKQVCIAISYTYLVNRYSIM